VQGRLPLAQALEHSRTADNCPNTGVSRAGRRVTQRSRRLFRKSSGSLPEDFRTCDLLLIWFVYFGAEGKVRCEMRDRFKRRQQAHVSSLDECTKVQSAFDANPGGQKAFGRLGTSVTTVRRSFADLQVCLNDKQKALETIQSGRLALRTLLKGVVRVSALADLEPVAAKVMQLPRKSSDELLLADAQAILDQVIAHKDVFLAEGLAPNVLTDLPAQIAQLTADRAAYSDAVRRYTATTDDIRRALDAGDDAVEVCASYLESLPGTDPAVIQKLRIARRVGPRSEAAPKPDTPAPATPPAPASPDPSSSSPSTTKIA
jgi:hypothetical protein